MPANIYINGVGLVTAIGDNVNEVLATASEGVPEPGIIKIVQSEGETRMRYFSIKDPAIDAGAGRIDAIIDKVIQQAVVDSGITAAQLAGAGLFVGSTSFDMYRCEMAIKASAKTAAEIARHIPTFNALTHYIQSRFAINGPVYTFNTACTSSANALLYAAEFIRRGDISHALVLGLEFFNEVTALGFSSLELISQQGMRPFASNRDGLYLGEGCGAVVISAQPRPLAQNQAADFVFKAGATIGDNFSLTASNPDGKTIQQVIERALVVAGLDKSAISLVKTHGTASLSNDEAEAAGLSRVFGTSVPPIIALKPFFGHTLGACGINEMIVFIALIKQRKLINSTAEIAADYPLRLATNEDVLRQGGHYLLNYFGFGGNNTALVIADA
jgi:3-oxoacyl-[acyl-carrier-protein] synthase-1